MRRNNCNGQTFNTMDHGPEPLFANINRLAKQNSYYRAALWTGDSLQMTLMSIPINGEIGKEMHPDVDQFIKIEEGCALVMIGEADSCFNHRQRVNRDYAVIIPAGTWHNIINIGTVPLKLYSIYAPPEHSHGTVHKTKADAEKTENSEN